LSTYTMFPAYFFTSAGAIPSVKVRPRLYVLLFIVVWIPLKFESICKSTPEVGVIVKLPPVPGADVNSVKSYPYVGDVCAVPTVLKPATVLSCQYFKTPVV